MAEKLAQKCLALSVDQDAKDQKDQERREEDGKDQADAFFQKADRRIGHQNPGRQAEDEEENPHPPRHNARTGRYCVFRFS
jgi:hypothetical protein